MTNGELVEVFHRIDFVHLAGYEPNTPVRVEVVGPEGRLGHSTTSNARGPARTGPRAVVGRFTGYDGCTFAQSTLRFLHTSESPSGPNTGRMYE